MSDENKFVRSPMGRSTHEFHPINFTFPGTEILSSRRSINNLQSVTKLIHHVSHRSLLQSRIKIPEKKRRKHSTDICRLTPLHKKSEIMYHFFLFPSHPIHVIIIVRLFVSCNITFIKQYFHAENDCGLLETNRAEVIIAWELSEENVFISS